MERSGNRLHRDATATAGRPQTAPTSHPAWASRSLCQGPPPPRRTVATVGVWT